MVNVDLLKQYIQGELNILLTGEAGTGKTTMLKTAAAELGMKMKYFSSATLDPYADLIGIPIPNHGQKAIEFYRPRGLDTAEIIFFDELNRADLAVINAVFEITQFRSLNGEKLYNLKSVVAAINPVGKGYATRNMDIALRDRFDIYLQTDTEPNWGYFKSRFGEQYTKAGFYIFKEYNKLREKNPELEYLSPRRLDKILSIFFNFPVVDSLVATFPTEEKLDFEHWANILLENRIKPKDGEEIVSDIESELERIEGKLDGNFVQDFLVNKKIFSIALAANKTNHPIAPYLNERIALRLNELLKTPEQVAFWKPVIRHFDKKALSFLINDWSNTKTSLLNN